ncbi:MAG: ACT domain-containing protein [Clostridiales bacterium]|jgi:hypothetical protein|nr:ACT domain-containing protein [Clostridiales bacterium]
MIKQLSVFVENKPGRLAEVTGCLSEAGINIHALCIADTTDFGILRLIVADADAAKAVLKQRGLTVKTTEVVGVALTHKPGSLYSVLLELEKADVSIEYMYAFTSRSMEYDAIVVFCLADQKNALEKLKGHRIPFIDAEVIKNMK